MSITPLPALDRLSTSFKTDLDTFFGSALPTMTTELNGEIARINTIGHGSYTATSSTSLTVGNGSKTLTIETGKSFAVGQSVIIAQTSAPGNYMAGQITAYDTGTGALKVNVTAVGGSGTASAWTISVAALLALSLPVIDSIVVLTSGTSWTNSGGWTKCKLRAVGGGGGGAAGSATYSDCPGAAGGYAEKLFSLTSGNSYTYSIGSGGDTVTGSGVDGNPGGNTKFNTGTATITCNGGSGGVHDGSATGGAASGGDVNIVGANGYFSVANNSTVPGAQSPLGYGSGGGSAAGSGMMGKAGVIILELYK